MNGTDDIEYEVEEIGGDDPQYHQADYVFLSIKEPPFLQARL